MARGQHVGDDDVVVGRSTNRQGPVWQRSRGTGPQHLSIDVAIFDVAGPPGPAGARPIWVGAASMEMGADGGGGAGSARTDWGRDRRGPTGGRNRDGSTGCRDRGRPAGGGTGGWVGGSTAGVATAAGPDASSPDASSPAVGRPVAGRPEWESPRSGSGVAGPR